MSRHVLSHLVVGLLMIVTPNLYASTLAHFWSNGYGSASNDYADRTVAVDAAGNVYVAGSFENTVDFGGGPLVSAGSVDIFIARFAPDGSHLWSLRLGGTGYDTATWLGVDASGDVYVTGSFSNTVDFGGGALVSAGGNDAFLAKYDGATGAHVWSQRFGSGSADQGRSGAVDGAGNVLMAGGFYGTVDFGGGGLVSAGSEDIVLAKYDAATGAHVWSQRFGSTLMDRCWDVESDGSAIYITGDFQGTVDFGGGGLVSAGGWDIFVARYDAAGAHQWSRGMGGATGEGGYALAIDSSGDLTVAGEIGSGVDLGGGVLPYSAQTDFFLAKYDGATGAHMWSQAHGGTGYDGGWDLAIDSGDNLLVGGWMFATVDFGGGPLTSAGVDDAWLAKYDKDGNHVWSVLLGGTATDYTGSIAADGAGNVILAVHFSDTVDFGGGPLIANGVAWDIALVKYAGDPAEPVITSIEDIGNDQGGEVKIRWTRSGYDQMASPDGITEYEAYRRDDPAPASAATADLIGLSSQELMAEGWTYVGSAPAHGETGYGLDVPTIGDSTITSGQYYSSFYIRASTADPYTFYDSAPDSGYSLDNLAPGVPASFVFNAGMLAWDESNAADFDYFTVYGSNTNDFGTATVVDYTVAPTMDVTASPYFYYFVTATDFSGNEGNPANLDAVTGANGTPAAYVLSVSNYPNPFNPSTTVKYTVPSRGVVTVAIYDARGSRVATLVNGEHAAGVYDTTWNGRSDSGAAVSSGVYFARIDQNGAARSKKMVLLK